MPSTVRLHRYPVGRLDGNEYGSDVLLRQIPTSSLCFTSLPLIKSNWSNEFDPTVLLIEWVGYPCRAEFIRPTGLSSIPFLIFSEGRMLIDSPTLGFMVILINYPELRPGSQEQYQQQYCQNGGTCGGEHI